MTGDKNSHLINLSFALVIVFFFAAIFFPAIYVLKYISDPVALSSLSVLRAVAFSVLIGFTVTLADLLLGVPLAHLVARSKRRYARWIDNLVDLSLMMPTTALGFSVFLYWGSSSGLAGFFGADGGLIGRGGLMIILLHIVFTLPYMVRSTAAAIAQIDRSREEAALTLGANEFTLFRTISLPLARDGIVNGCVLAFTRSLSETGATMMVAGFASTAPMLIIGLKEQGRLAEASAASIVMILVAVSMLLLAKKLAVGKHFVISHVYPNFERKLSGLGKGKDALLISLFSLFIFLPSVYIVLYYIFHIGHPDYAMAMRSILVSFGLASFVTVLNTLLSIPMAYLIARDVFRSGRFFDSLNEIVLLMPTGALGLSIALFWRQFLDADYLILAMAHLCFTFPLLVKPIAAAIRNVDFSQEEAAHILGASRFKTFVSIIIPQIKPAIIAGAIMAFMRSLSETGATLAVSSQIKTASVLIVDLFRKGNTDGAVFICVIMFAVASAFLVFLKRKHYA